MKLIAILMLMLIACSAHARGVTITEAYYRDTNAGLHIFLRNDGTTPVSILPPSVNGHTSGASRDEKRDRGILWHRCRPNPVPPGGMADVTITLAEPPKGNAVVSLETSTGEKIRRTVPCVPERIRLQAIRFSKDLRSADVYVRCSDVSPVSLRSIRLDGRDVHGKASPWPARAFRGLAYTRLTFPEPLARNSFHIFEVTTDSRLSTAYQVRAIPAEFLIGVYGTPSPEHIEDWAAHGFNHYLAFGSVSPEQLKLMEARGISVGAKYIPEPLVDRQAGTVPIFDTTVARAKTAEVSSQPALIYHHLVDEPDVADYYAGRWLGSTSMELAARAEFVERIDPGRYTFVQLDNTFRPGNYRVYGEAADILATHRYSLGNALRSEAGERTTKQLPFLDDLVETTTRLRLAVEPKPFFMVPQFFNLGAGRSGRAPTVAEMRLQCYAMVAGGARGVIHYIHSGSTGGGEGGRTKTLWDGMTGLNEELKRVGEVASVGTPSPEGWVKTSTPNALPSLLLCGDRMALVLINRAHRSALGGFTARPIKGMQVSIAVPPWIEASGLKITNAATGEPIPSQLRGSEITFVTGEMTDAPCFLLTPR